MFYSQFILAKKGPLGTIWIAAHLERKLRKNQVADTDIGVSVDSILCPEVPIALRLSSHLMLGVVRIYSRKVNYLFHDCSEALLKIKQAFRSTAVDLPPEESTAPYHSITLPETFDLDDFELPDAVLQGNFVDHHVSTREQITLQDRVENTSYTATQFGLDERFGDGDTSQIGLDFDEELFSKKDISPSNVSLPSEKHESGLDVRLSVQPETPLVPSINMDVDVCPDDLDRHRPIEDSTQVLANDDRNVSQTSLLQDHVAGASLNLQGYNIRTPDLNEIALPHESTGGPDAVQTFVDVHCPVNGPSIDLLGPAQAPSTPGLLEEAAPVHLQDTSSSHQGKSSPSNDAEDILTGPTQTAPGCQEMGGKMNNSFPLSKCSDMAIVAVINQSREDHEKPSEIAENEVLQEESVNIHTNMPKHDHIMTVEADEARGFSQEHIKDVEVAPSTFSSAVHNKPIDVHVNMNSLDHSVIVGADNARGSTQQYFNVVEVAPSKSCLLVHDEPIDVQAKICDMSSSMTVIGDNAKQDYVKDVEIEPLTSPLPAHNKPTNIQANMHGLDHTVNVEADNAQGTLQDYHKDSESGSFLCVDGKLTSPRTNEINHTCTAQKPGIYVAIQNKPMVVLNSSQTGRIVSSDLDFPLQPCNAKEQINGFPLENQVAKDDNGVLISTCAGDKAPQGGNSLLESEGEKLPSVILNTGSLMNWMTGNSSHTSNCSANPEPETVLVASTSSAGLINERDHYIGEKGKLETERNINMSPSLSINHGSIDNTWQCKAAERTLEPDGSSHMQPNISSAHSLIDDSGQYSAGKKTLEFDGSAHRYQNLLINHGSSDDRGQHVAEKCMLSPDGSAQKNLNLSSSYGLIDESRQHIGDKMTLGPNGSADTYLNLSNTHSSISERERCLAEKEFLGPGGSAQVHPSLSGSHHGLIHDSTRCIAGNKIPELDGRGNIYPGLSGGRGHYPEPERIMLASTSTHGLTNDIEQSFSGRNSNSHLYNTMQSRVLSFGESTPVLLGDSSARLPELTHSKRKACYNRDDGDLLASILVGKKRNSSTKRSYCPPLPSTPLSKRPRLTPKQGVHKRKVLIDDTMVVHADAIRQQLMNTEDTRRMRRKAPCTRFETWTLQKFSLEDDVFSETVLTGMFPELASFHYQIYDQNKSIHARGDSIKLPINSSKIALHKESNVSCSVLVRSDNHNPTGPGQVDTEKFVHSNNHLKIDSQHESSHISLACGVNDHTMGLEGAVQLRPLIDGAEKPVHSNNILGTDVQIESSHVSLVHGIDDHITGLEDAVQPRPSTDNVTPVIPTVMNNDAHDSDQKDDNNVKPNGSIGIDPCLTNDLLLTQKDNYSEASNVIVTREFIPPVGCFEEKDNTPVSTKNALLVDDNLPVLECMNAVHDTAKDAEPSLLNYTPYKDSFNDTPNHVASKNANPSVVVTEAHCLNAEQVSLVDTPEVVAFNDALVNVVSKDVEPILIVTEKKLSNSEQVSGSAEEVSLKSFNDTSLMAPAEVADNGSLLVPENKSAVLHEVHKACVEAGTTGEQKIDTALDCKEMSPSDKSSSKPISSAVVERFGMDVSNKDEGAQPISSAVVEIFGTDESNRDEVAHMESAEGAATAKDSYEAGMTSEQKIDTALDYKEMSPSDKSSSKAISSAVVERFGMDESNRDEGAHVESAGTAKDSYDPRTRVNDGNGTEFLNMDDEVIFDEIDHEIRNSADDQALENSGWSTRTRGVARYLKLLFDEETGYGRKNMHLEHILSGKSRKEASRMFFETLVLKTRDYINVEQDVAFASIKIEPRTKLLKTTL